MMWLVYALASAVLWGLNYAIFGYLLASKQVNGYLMLLVASAASVVTYVAVMLVQREPGSWAKALDPNVWPLLTLQTVVMVLANIFTFYAIRGSNATVASLVEITYPLFVGLFAWWLFHESHLSVGSIIGAILIFIGVALVVIWK